MDDNGKAEATRQLIQANINPIVAAVVAAIHAAVILLEEYIRVGGMQRQFMHALPDTPGKVFASKSASTFLLRGCQVCPPSSVR